MGRINHNLPGLLERTKAIKERDGLNLYSATVKATEELEKELGQKKETTQSKRTQGPWGTSSEFLICNEKAEVLASTMPIIECGVDPEEAQANAAFIVTACNAHDALVEACKEFLACGPNAGHNADLIAKVKAALALAERG